MYFANRWDTDSDRITFDLTNGRVGIGTTSTPTVKLHTVGDRIWLQRPASSTNAGFEIVDESGGFNVRGGLAVAATAGAFSNNAAPGDVVVRALGGDLHFGASTSMGTAPDTQMLIDNATGNVNIGTVISNPTYKLLVNGKIKAKEVRVETTGYDFVFDDNYQLMSLSDVEAHIKQKKHLPGIPSAAEVEADGVSLGEMQGKLLQKIEELTLYMLELKKENKSLKERLDALKTNN